MPAAVLQGFRRSQGDRALVAAPLKAPFLSAVSSCDVAPIRACVPDPCLAIEVA